MQRLAPVQKYLTVKSSTTKCEDLAYYPTSCKMYISGLVLYNIL